VLKGGDESVLREVFGQPNIAHHPRQAGNQPRRLNPPDCVDCAMSIGSHRYPSHHLLIPQRKPQNVREGEQATRYASVH
jgi:hypothetical protein